MSVYGYVMLVAVGVLLVATVVEWWWRGPYT